MHSETQSDLSQAGLQIAIQDIKDDLFDTPECDYAIAQLLNRWGQAKKPSTYWMRCCLNGALPLKLWL